MESKEQESDRVQAYRAAMAANGSLGFGKLNWTTMMQREKEVVMEKMTQGMLAVDMAWKAMTPQERVAVDATRAAEDEAESSKISFWRRIFR